MSKILLKLYIAGQTTRSSLAITKLFQILVGEFAHQYELEIIDVIELPQLAELEKILVTPTLIKENPLPKQRLIGDFYDKEKVVMALGAQMH